MHDKNSEEGGGRNGSENEGKTAPNICSAEMYFVFKWDYFKAELV